MKVNKLLTIGTATAAISLLGVQADCTSCESMSGDSTKVGQSESKTVADKETAKKTIVEIAAGNENFSTLVAAVKAAGLAEALSGDGPFTVFAPTNAAFEKLPEGTVETLLKEENKGQLAKILKYHVVAGKVMAADVKPGKVATLQGSKATIKASGGSVLIDNAKVVKTDIVGSNGVIHVIDTVIMPKK